MATNRLTSYLFDTGNKSPGDDPTSGPEDETIVEPEQGNGELQAMQRSLNVEAYCYDNQSSLISSRSSAQEPT